MADYNYGYHYSGGGQNDDDRRKNNKGKKELIPWWAIIVAFAVAWPLGIVLTLVKLGMESSVIPGGKGGKSAQQSNLYQQGGYSTPQSTVDPSANSAGRNQKHNAPGAQSSAPQGTFTATKGNKTITVTQGAQDAGAQGAGRSGKLQERMKKLKSGKGLITLGLIMMGVCGVAAGMNFADNFYLLGTEPLWVLEEVLPSFVLTGMGAGLFTCGQVRKNQYKRFHRYLTLIGDQKTVSITALAEAFPAKRSKVCAALEDMIDAGVFGERAYLDYGRDLLVLDGSGVKAQDKPREEKKAAPATAVGEENDLLRQIREVNEDIENPELSRKIYRIEEITQRILEFQKEHPDKAGELRKFLNYYLPTTLKILNAYAQLENQGVEGENITATKQRIEGMMDMVVEGFERQLDKLFAGDMMDIAADITVMEQMMQGDGLADNEDRMKGGH